jgi:hypothetical protein
MYKNLYFCLKIKQIMKKLRLITIILTVISSAFFLFSCSNDDNLSANITLTEGVNGDIGGDFNGNGGNASRTYSWQNSLSTADYNADITASTRGLFQIIVKDSNGVTVLDRSINGNVEPDSFSGVSAAGTAGIWTITISVSNFNGDGSFTLSEGN